jgi:hypothetical protein
MCCAAFSTAICFSADETLFNPTLVVFCLRRLAVPDFASQLLQMTDATVLNVLQDENLKLSTTLFSFLRSLHGDVDSALISLFGAQASPLIGGHLKRTFSLWELEARPASTSTSAIAPSVWRLCAGASFLLRRGDFCRYRLEDASCAKRDGARFALHATVCCCGAQN